MSEYWVDRFVWDEAGLGYFEDGVYAHDFGWMTKIADWSETWWDGPEDHGERFREGELVRQ